MVHDRKREDGVAVLLSLFYTLLVLGLVLTSITGPRKSGSVTDRCQDHQTRLLHLTDAGLALALYEIHGAKTLADVPMRQWSLQHALGGRLWGSVDITLDEASRRLLAIVSVHERSDPDRGLESAPNRILARASSSVGLGRVSFRPPAKTPLVLGQASRLHLETDLVLESSAGEATLAFARGQALHPELPSGCLAMELSVDHLEFRRILGRDHRQLRLLADRRVPIRDPIGEIRSGLTHVAGGKHLGSRDPLRGEGFVVVDGDLTLSGSQLHELKGVLIVTGSLVIRGRARVEGMVVVLGGLRLEGTGDRPGLSVQFDENTLRRVTWEVAGFRFSGRPQLRMEPLQEHAQVGEVR